MVKSVIKPKKKLIHLRDLTTQPNIFSFMVLLQFLLFEHWNSNLLSSFLTISIFRNPLKALYWFKNLAKLGNKNSFIFSRSVDKFSFKYFSRIPKYIVKSLFMSIFVSFVILSLMLSLMKLCSKNSYFFLCFWYLSLLKYFCFILNSFSSKYNLYFSYNYS